MARGWTNRCPLLFTPSAGAVLGSDHAGTMECRYNHGPIMRPGKGVDVLASFQIELRGRHNDMTPCMKGSPAIVSGKHGSGRVVLVSPHMEDGQPAVLRQLFRLAAGVLHEHPPQCNGLPPLHPAPPRPPPRGHRFTYGGYDPAAGINRHRDGAQSTAPAAEPGAADSSDDADADSDGAGASGGAANVRSQPRRVWSASTSRLLRTDADSDGAGASGGAANARPQPRRVWSASTSRLLRTAIVAPQPESPPPRRRTRAPARRPRPRPRPPPAAATVAPALDEGAWTADDEAEAGMVTPARKPPAVPTDAFLPPCPATPPGQASAATTMGTTMADHAARRTGGRRRRSGPVPTTWSKGRTRLSRAPGTPSLPSVMPRRRQPRPAQPTRVLTVAKVINMSDLMMLGFP